MDDGPVLLGEDPGQIVGQAPAGDVGHGMEAGIPEDRAQGREVGPVGLQEDPAHGSSVGIPGPGIVNGEALLLEDDLPGQGVAVGVEAGGLQSQEHVADLHSLRAQQVLPVHRADHEAHELVVSGSVEARHLRHLAAQEGTPVLPAGGRHALHQGHHVVGLQNPGSHVVEEEEGLGPLDQDVVDAVVDQIDPHGGVVANLRRHPELGAHAVGGGHQDGRALGLGDREEPSEAPELGEDPLGPGGGHQLPDPGEGPLLGVDVDSGGLVGALLGHGPSSSPARIGNRVAWRSSSPEIGTRYFPVQQAVQ